MKAKMTIVTILLLLFLDVESNAQTLELYKQIDTTQLFLEIYQPQKIDTSRSYPAMVFFFGGGWNSGTRKQFIHQAQYFAEKDIICFLADYRIKNKHKSRPFEAVKDAKSAIRYIREHADKWQIDTSKIIASGGSAGGHLAAATALTEEYFEVTDDLNYSCKPNALVLYNAVVDNGPAGYGYERIGDEYKAFSPLHNIEKGAPPTILFLGTKDHLIPVTTYDYYKLAMDKVKSKCILKVYDGGKHGFFNYNKKDMYFFKSTLFDTQVFLEAIGFMDEAPNK